MLRSRPHEWPQEGRADAYAKEYVDQVVDKINLRDDVLTHALRSDDNQKGPEIV